MKIAFLGLGIMGSRMAANLLSDGHELTVWNRTTATAEQFGEQHGVPVAASPQAAASAADLVISMVVDGSQVEHILLGPDGAAGAPGSKLFVDCSTIGPAQALRLDAGLRARGHRFIDAPVTGSSPRAQDGTLVFMVGAAEADLAAAMPAFEAMGKLTVRCGKVGQGQVIKVINNALAAVNATALGQALIVAQAAGADLGALIQVAGAGSGGSMMLDLKAEPMRAHDFTTLFKLDHMLKDVRLCLAEAADAGVPFAFASATETVLAEGSQAGLGDRDFAALIEPLERSAGVRLGS
jgi:3-hydroxyisobutyrate dehydrogenase-like beta-hydroxyacid dehydrogenase